MKSFLGVFFLYWLTGLSSKPILACDAHPGVPHERWLQFVNQVNAADSAKAEAAAPAKKKEPGTRDSARPRRSPTSDTIRVGR